ncbi:hypothetical protein INR49_007222 [Caranx melampygus]|nr:hypothetical protein INR49_007222 [Caranx melampygus]
MADTQVDSGSDISAKCLSRACLVTYGGDGSPQKTTIPRVPRGHIKVSDYNTLEGMEWEEEGRICRDHMDLKEKKLVEEKENGKDAATNGKENEENGEPDVDDEEDEEVDEEDEEDDGEGDEEDEEEDDDEIEGGTNGQLRTTRTTTRTTSKPRSRKPTTTIDAFSRCAILLNHFLIFTSGCFSVPQVEGWRTD